VQDFGSTAIVKFLSNKKRGWYKEIVHHEENAELKSRRRFNTISKRGNRK